MVAAGVLGQAESQWLLSTADELLLNEEYFFSLSSPSPPFRRELRQGTSPSRMQRGWSDMWACRQSKLSARRKCNFQNFIKDLMFFFSCLGCSQVISMTTGQQPSFLKTDNQSSDCLSAHQPLIKMSERIELVANKWIKEVETSKIIKFLGICEHQRLEAQMSVPAERDAAELRCEGCAWQRAALRARGSARPAHPRRCHIGHRPATGGEPIAASESEPKPQETWLH